MTTIYVPRLIESAEQAEALPHGTWARSDVGGGIPEETVVRTADERQPWRNGPAAWSSSEIVGWTALVPIGAEETQSEGTGWIVPTAFGPKLAGAYLGSPDGTPPKRYNQTTWRTPWEEQS